MKSIFLTALLGLSLASAQESTSTPDLAPIEQSAQEDLKAALEKLSKVRQKIAQEQPALAKEFASVQSELITKRRQADLAKLSQQERASALRESEQLLYQLTQDQQFVDSLISDLPTQLKSRASSAELPLLEKNFESPKKSSNSSLNDRITVLEKSLDRLETLLGGQQFEGKAIDPQGNEVTGKFAQAGPLVWFANDQVAALVRGGADQIPHLSVTTEADATKALVQSGKGEAALDFTGGSAQALADLESSAIDLIRKGGFWVWPIMLIALISVICALLKLRQLMQIRQPGEHWVAEILSSIRKGETTAAQALASQPKHPAAELISRALEYWDAGADAVEEALYESMIGVQSRLQKWLPFIAVTAATAPLLGLLGTVSGMIATFNVIQLYGSGDPKPLAGGISEALITTLFGLIVAIPALILHAILSRRCQGVLHTSEQLGLTLVNGLRRIEKTQSNSV